MSLVLITQLLIAHFVADFILQTNWMAVNKSNRMVPLLAHVGVYTTVFMVFGWKFAIFNGVAHLGVDFFTSRITSKLWKLEKRHWFFVVIGLDQLVHTLTLIWTAGAML